jgi:hypothetical protein
MKIDHKEHEVINLTKEHTKQNDAIEKYFCPILKGKNTMPMSKEIAEVFMQVTFASLLGTPVPIPTGKDFEKLPFEARVLLKRVEVCFDYKIEDLGIVLLLVFIGHSLGGIIMYLTMIQHHCKENKVRLFTFDEFTRMFGNGVYSKEILNKAWDAQKVPAAPDNLLDYPVALNSLRF